MTAREKHVTAHHLLLNLDEIKIVWHQRRWEELAAVVEYAQKDVPVILSKTDPHLYQLLRNAVTEFNLRGYDNFNLAAIEVLAEQALKPQGTGKGGGMNGGLSRDDWRGHLERLGEELQDVGQKMNLVLLGSVPNILQGQKGRTTIDLNIWKPKSKFDALALRRATEQTGMLYDPKGENEPTAPYIQIVDVGIVQLGEFKPVRVDAFGGLTLWRPPYENLIASKLCRAVPQDLDDINWMFATHSVDIAAIKKVIATFPRQHRVTASENLVFLSVVTGTDVLPDVPSVSKERVEEARKSALKQKPDAKNKPKR